MKILSLDPEGIRDETEVGFTGYKEDPREPVEGLDDDEIPPPQTKEGENTDYNLDGTDNDQSSELKGK